MHPLNLTLCELAQKDRDRRRHASLLLVGVVPTGKPILLWHGVLRTADS